MSLIPFCSALAKIGENKISGASNFSLETLIVLPSGNLA